MTLKASMETARDLLLAHKTGGIPTGERFQRLGSGAFRTAYLDRETTVVYKFDHTPGDPNGNTGELRNLLDNAWAMPYVSPSGTVVRLPEFEGFQFGQEYVVAMEYCPNSDYVTDYYERSEASRWFGLTDVMGENVRMGDNDEAVITDCGLSSDEVRQAREKRRMEHECDGCYHHAEAPALGLPERDVWRP